MNTSLQTRTKILPRTFAALCLLMIFRIDAIAATFTSAASGSWATPANWTISGGSAAGTTPGAADNVIIQAVHSISISAPATINALTVTGSLTVSIPNGILKTNSVALNPSATIGNITVTTGNLRVENSFNLSKLNITLDGSGSSITCGGTYDIVRGSEYIVLNNRAQLIMENMGKGGPSKRAGNVLFPIGTGGSYTPMNINNFEDNKNATRLATFAVTLSPNVYLNGSDGQLVANAVNRTWQVTLLDGDAEANITLNWNVANEPAGFDLPNSEFRMYTTSWDLPATGGSTLSGRSLKYATYMVSTTATNPVTFPRFAVFDGGITPLPVELTSFTAIKKNAEVALSWETASEKNCQGFEIQTSADGKNYKALDFINSANGNSASAQRYAYTHKTGSREGLIYYRLKQVDLDGKATYYHAKVVDLGRFTNAATIYPNPFQDKFKLELQATEVGNAEIIVRDLTGRTIVHNQPILVKGTNTIDISLKDAPAGVYLINATAGGHTYTDRIVKQ